MPDVDDGAGRQPPSLRPVDAIVVGDLAALAGARVETSLLAPLRFESNAIRGIGHHENREWLNGQQSRGVFAGGSVAAQYSVLRVPFATAQQPEIAGPGDRGCGNIRNFVFVREPRGGLLGQLARQFLVVETEQIQVETLVLQGYQLFAEHLLVPACVERELVIGDGQGATLDLGQVLQHNDWHSSHALHPGRPEAPFTSDEPTVRPHENWIYETEFPDGGGNLRHLLGGVRARVNVARGQSVHGPVLDLDIRMPHKLVPTGLWAGARYLLVSSI